MLKKLLIVAFCFLVLTGFTYPEDQGAVTDSAQLLSAQAKRELVDELTCFRDRTGILIQVVTVTQNEVGNEGLIPYSRALFSAWQSHFSPDAQRVVLLMAASKRGFRILVSRSLRDPFSDTTIARISGEMLPPLQQNEWGPSILCGVRGIEHVLIPDFQYQAARTDTSLTGQPTVTGRARNENNEREQNLIWAGKALCWVLLAVAVVCAWKFFSGGRRKRGRRHLGLTGDDVEGAAEAMQPVAEAIGEAGGNALRETFRRNESDGWLGGDGGGDLTGGVDSGGGGDFGGDGGSSGDW